MIAPSAIVSPGACVIGNVTVGENAFILFNAVLRGDMNSITIGEQTSVQDCTVIHTDWEFPATVGKRVTIGHNSTLHGCTIGDDVIIGMGSIVLNGAHVPDKCIIAAGSLVGQHKKLESGWLYAGVPVEKKKKLTENDLKYLEFACNAYLTLAEKYRKE